jgi:hypothetical protein
VNATDGEHWYPRSCLKRDTHYGYLTTRPAAAVVVARCGAEFAAQPDMFTEGAFAVALLPVPLVNQCEECAAKAPHGDEVQQRTGKPLRGTFLQRDPSLAASDAEQISHIVARIAAEPDVTSPSEQPETGAVDDGRRDAASRALLWYRASRTPGDTHLVTRLGRGTQDALCGVSFQGGRSVSNPTPSQVCPKCEARRLC